ncbi:MAG: sensor histidine kinase [Chitinophagaceae bacterium]
MHSRKWILLSFICQLYFIAGYGQLDTFVLNPVNNPALKEYNLRRMAVDKNNNLWFGTDKGIVKFDGNDLNVYDKIEGDTNTLSINSLGTIYFDRQDNLYVIGVGAFIDALNIRTGKVSRLKIQLREEDKTKRSFPFAFSCVSIDTDSTIWAGMYNIGFIHFDRRINKTLYYTVPKRNESINSTVFDIQADLERPDILWIATYDGIYSFNKKTKQFAGNFQPANPKASSVYDRTIICLDVNQRDTIWFTIPLIGFGCYDKRTGLYTIMKDINKQTGKVTTHYIDRIQRRNAHEIFMSSDAGLPGIFNTANHTYTYNFRLNEKYPSVQQKHFLEDSIGNFWSLMFYQLYKAEKNKKSFRTVLFPDNSRPNNLPNIFKIALWDEPLQAYYAVFDGRSAVVVLDKGMKQVRKIPIDLSYTSNPLAEPDIYDAIIDKKGRLWLVGSSVWVYNDRLQKLQVVNTKKMDLTSMGLQNMVNRGDYIYLQPSRPSFKAIYRVNINDFSYDSIPLPVQVISDTTEMNQLGKQMDVLEMDNKGEFAYFCYGRTLFQLNLITRGVKTIRTLPPVDELKGFQHFYNMFWYKLDAKNNLWVATMEGIKIYDAVSLQLIKEIAPQKDSYPLQLFHAGAEQIMCYLYSNGVILYDYAKNREFKLSLSDGLATIFNSGMNVSNNVIFVGAYDYFHYTSFSDIVNNSNQRRCYLSNIALFNKPFRTDTVPEFLHLLELPYHKNYVSFTFSSTEYDQPERLEYRYKLEEVNENWVYVSYLNRTATYNNLKPGNYTFYAAVKNTDGNWSNDGVRLQLIIVPAWWQTSWFKFIAILAMVFVIFWLVRWRINTVRKQEQLKASYEKELLELEAKALRAQMNPHFIFNSLNSIKSLINKNENDKAADYLTTFSKLIRTLFQNSDKREVSLHDELETCKLYTQIEKMRFGDKLDFVFEVDKAIDLKDIKVPALILQPFIENAIWHGLVPQESGGKVVFSVKEKNEAVVCTIDDDGIGRELSKQYKAQYEATHQSKGIGLTQSRLELDKLLNDREDTIEIIDKQNEDGTPGGTTIIITFKENGI